VGRGSELSELFFKDEESMYEVIKNYLVDNGYQVIIDKPRGFSVKFKALKAWIIDVIAVKKVKILRPLQ
jgi:hypothetical protein